MQNDAYVQSMNQLWWVEGSAEWAAHKVVTGTTERDHKIEQFFNRQKECSLTQHSYDAQPFFFWGEQMFDTSWGISLGMGGRQYLKRPSRAAQILPPERWLDWAIAQAAEIITMPDGRPLPHQAAVEPLDLSDSCGASIQGPPLSVQLRELRFPLDGESPIKIEPHGAQVAYLNSSGEWIRITSNTEINSPTSPMYLVAIMPSGNNLDVKLSLTNSNIACGCHVGRWKEVATADSDAEDSFKGALEAMDQFKGMIPPDQLENLNKAKQMIESADTKDRFRFRDATKQLFEMDGGRVSYIGSGPTVTFAADGKFQIDDPHTIQNDKTKVTYRVFTHTGKWEFEDEVLKIDIKNINFLGTVEGPNSDGPKEISSTNKNSSYVGGGGDWIVSCEDSGFTLIPADEKKRRPGKNAVLRPH
ncbi:hypothetical protein [Pleionea sediminis]|uniref:hypothetical protein n=1 Tax=Pleionea sediminis TaxID=2569479 RepID=UPI001FE5DA6A|nr:hypothetical protein [Pleionea sediminis]